MIVLKNLLFPEGKESIVRLLYRQNLHRFGSSFEFFV